MVSHSPSVWEGAKPNSIINNKHPPPPDGKHVGFSTCEYALHRTDKDLLSCHIAASANPEMHTYSYTVIYSSPLWRLHVKTNIARSSSFCHGILCIHIFTSTWTYIHQEEVKIRVPLQMRSSSATRLWQDNDLSNAFWESSERRWKLVWKSYIFLMKQVCLEETLLQCAS